MELIISKKAYTLRGKCFNQPVECSAASYYLPEHRTFNITPNKMKNQIWCPFREVGSVETTTKYLSLGLKERRKKLGLVFASELELCGLNCSLRTYK